MLAGGERFELLLDRLTTAPPAGAAPLNVAVQEVEPGVLSVEGEQDRPDTVTGTMIVRAIEPPDPVSGKSSPAAEVAREPVMPMDADAAPGASTAFTDPSVPPAIVVAFMPKTMQLVCPGPVVPQDTVLPAAVAALPAVTDKEAISAGAYVKVHCMPAGWLLDAEWLRVRVTAPSEVAVPEDKLIEPDCPFAGNGTRSNNIPRLATTAIEAHRL